MGTMFPCVSIEHCIDSAETPKTFLLPEGKTNITDKYWKSQNEQQILSSTWCRLPN